MLPCMSGIFNHLFQRLWPMACLVVGLSGCGWQKPPVERKAEDRFFRDMMEGRRAMGQITEVNEAKGFVLLRSPVSRRVQPETDLVVRAVGDGAVTAKLRISPERTTQFLAADVTEGAPSVGDAVFFPADQKPVSTAPPALTTTPSPTDIGAPADTLTPDSLSPADRLPFSMSDVPPPATGREDALPPLGRPSGSEEDVPDFAPLPEPPAE